MSEADNTVGPIPDNANERECSAQSHDVDSI